MKAPLAHLSLNRIDEALFQTTAIRQFEYLLNVSLGVGARALILGTIGLVALATAAFLSNTPARAGDTRTNSTRVTKVIV